jgi:hypothetical protein
MSNGEKAGRVFQVCGVQLQNKFLSEQFRFHFLLTIVCFIQISVVAFLYGVSDIFMSAFQMEMNDYPHFNLTEDGTLCSMGQHCPGFPRVLYDAFIHLGYDGDALIYCCRLSMAHGMDQCEVSMMIPFNPTEPWLGSVISSEPDTSIELMAHIALTSLCEDHLAGTAALPIAILLIQDQENPIWQQCLKAMSNLKGPSLPCRDDFVGQVCAVTVQPSAQHRQDRHTAAYTSDGIEGECHCRHPRD